MVSSIYFTLEPDYVTYRIVWRKMLGHRMSPTDSRFMAKYMPKRDFIISQKIGPIGNTSKFVVFW